MAGESRLFRGAPDWYHNACINYGLDPWWVYSEGYHRAVEVLTNHAMESRGDLDCLVFPIVFLARHSLELRIKDLIQTAAILNKAESKPSLSHKLTDLWGSLRDRLVDLFPGDDPAALQDVDNFVSELSRFDHSSTTFRYPENTEGAPSLDSTIRHINVRQFFEQYQRAAEFLNGIQLEFSERLEVERVLDSYVDHGE